MKIKAIGFDLGGTLIEYHGLPLDWLKYYEEAFDQVSSSLLLDINKAKIQDAISVLEKYNARINPREIEYSSDHIFTEATQTWTLHEHSVSDVADCFYRFFHKRARVFPEAPRVLKSLYENKIKIGILSDLATGMPDKLIEEAVELLYSKIDCLLTSNYVGMRKPNTQGYLRLAKEMKINVDEFLFVGDEEKDILGARKAGMTPVLIDRGSHNKDYGQAYTIGALHDILSLI